MIEIYTAIMLVWVHFAADFLLQSDSVAKNKSSDNYVLLFHVILYTIPFMMFGVVFALVNGVLHFMTDWVTSRMTSWLYKRDQRHWFFVVIGADQAIHLSCLLFTYALLGSRVI